MADHYSRSLDLVNEVEQISDKLDATYAQRDPDRREIGRLHHDLGVALKLGAIHADLAIATSLHDVRAAIESGR